MPPPNRSRGNNYYRRGNWVSYRRKNNSKHRSANSFVTPSAGSTSPPANERSRRSIPVSITCDYGGWNLYFPHDDYAKSSAILTKVKAVEDFIERNKDLFNEEDIEDRRACVFDLKTCLNDEIFTSKWPEFKNELFNNPEDVLNCLGIAVHQVLWKSAKELAFLQGEETTEAVDIPFVKAYIINYDEITHLKNLKTKLFGKLVSVCGTVIRVSNARLRCSWMAFECTGCSTVQCVIQPEGVATLPTRCSKTDCRYKTFTPLRSSPMTQTVDWQLIQLQESAPDDQREGGRVPRVVECELTDDLVGSCTPGDVITLTGIVKIRNSEDANCQKQKSTACMYSLCIEAVGLTNAKNVGCVGGRNIQNNVLMQFTPKDYEAIREIHSEPSLFRLLVNSLCPTIYGHEIVKAGLLLALFGGAESDKLGNRGHAHVLVVGDPGLGKSQMLQSCAHIAPRGVFVCGNATTSSGLTVTMTREGGGDYALEAGALILADQGCCCIDEFDKMTSQHQALLEVMEQQTVSVAKAGVICTLPARTTILAAANPTGGHYNKGKTVSENLKLGHALLSRFDLVFILLDCPNERIDGLLSEHIMALHSGIINRTEHNYNDGDCPLSASFAPLSERLKIGNRANIDLIPPQLMRKYIAYAKKYVKQPVLSKEAKDVLQTFYLKLRDNHQTGDSTPVTTRQLQSLVRLTQARAKLELREEATMTDALDVVELMRWSLLDTFTDQYGALDFQRSQHGSGMSSKNQAKRFLTALHRQSEIQSRIVFTISEMKEIATISKIQVGDFYSFICTLNNQGFLLKKGKNSYQILSAG